MTIRYGWMGAALVAIAAIGLLGCGDDSSSGADATVINLTDAADGADAAPTVACNPVSQGGCLAGEKCATLVESDEPFLARTACVPDGTVDEYGDCVQGAAGAATGYDDCKAGLACRVGLCRTICSQAPNTCNDGNCVLISTLFQDLESVGLCAAKCDPVVQDCPGNDACYLNSSLGESSCSRVPPETEGIVQGDDCYGPQEGSCYLNGCPEGFSPLLNKGGPDGPGGSVCTAFCSPVIQHSGDTSALGGDPNGVTCADRGAISAHCRFINSFYSNTGMVPNSVGFCVPPDLWDTCANHTLGSMDAATFVPGCEPNGSAAGPPPSRLPRLDAAHQLPLSMPR